MAKQIRLLIALATLLSIYGCSKEKVLPVLTERQVREEYWFIKDNYFKPGCFSQARNEATKTTYPGSFKDEVFVIYTVTIGLDERSQDGRIHLIYVLEDKRMAYIQSLASYFDQDTSPVYGPVPLEKCLVPVLAYNSDNCRYDQPGCQGKN
jgi:hypothetical protein